MNVTQRFAEYLQTEGYGTLGTNLFIGGCPIEAPDTTMWILSSGGNNIGKNNTGEKQKNYIISVFYRSTDAQEVYDTLEELENKINENLCEGLTGYAIMETETTQFPTDQDIDNETRTIGLLQVALTIYK